MIPGSASTGAAMNRGVLAAILVVALAVVVQAQWLNYPTPGIPRTADGKPDLNASTPRTADGRPDLSGVWEAEDARWFFDLTKEVEPGRVVMTPWATGVQRQREARDHVDDPNGYCLPPGVPRAESRVPFRLLQTPTMTAILYEFVTGNVYRQVFTDGRPFPQVSQETWLGYSIGHWDGDVFVVESTGFRDGGWLDTEKGHPHSDALTVTERFVRRNVGRMDVVVTIDDPKAFVTPWTATMRMQLLPDTEMFESFCDNQMKILEHWKLDPAPPEPHSPPLTGSR
jgi:hypothetical protein